MDRDGATGMVLTRRRGITFLLQAILFRIAPTALEISMVCGILVSSSPSFAFIDLNSD